MPYGFIMHPNMIDIVGGNLARFRTRKLSKSVNTIPVSEFVSRICSDVRTLSGGQGLECLWGVVTSTKKNISVPFQLVQKKSVTRPSNSRNPLGHVRQARFYTHLSHNHWSDDASMRDPHCEVMLSGRTSHTRVESISFLSRIGSVGWVW